MLITTGRKFVEAVGFALVVCLIWEASASLLFLFFILMVRGLYDGAGVEAFFCLLAVVL